jgi:hypothetical protein
MTTSFEFIKRDERRIAIPRPSIIVFLSSVLIFVVMNLSMRWYSNNLQNEFQKKSSEVKSLAMEFLAKANAKMPDKTVFDQLNLDTLKHNNNMGGIRSSWTSFFNKLEAILPEEAIVMEILNSRTEKSVFDADDRAFKVLIAVKNKDTANEIYRALANKREFESLSFTPKGEVFYQGRNCLSIELAFRYNEKNG